MAKDENRSVRGCDLNTKLNPKGIYKTEAMPAAETRVLPVVFAAFASYALDATAPSWHGAHPEGRGCADALRNWLRDVLDQIHVYGTRSPKGCATLAIQQSDAFIVLRLIHRAHPCYGGGRSTQSLDTQRSARVGGKAHDDERCFICRAGGIRHIT